jgi:hypothetical protein
MGCHKLASSLPHDSKAAILARLKTAHGHLDGIIRLVIRDTYCVGVVKQTDRGHSRHARSGRSHRIRKSSQALPGGADISRRIGRGDP